MCRECRESVPRHRLQRKPLVSDPGMHHGTCVAHVLWCMSRSLTRGSGENFPGIPGACATRNFTYLVRGPLEGGNRAPQDAPTTRSVVRSFCVPFAVSLGKMLNKWPISRWFQTPRRSCAYLTVQTVGNHCHPLFVIMYNDVMPKKSDSVITCQQCMNVQRPEQN